MSNKIENTERRKSVCVELRQKRRNKVSYEQLDENYDPSLEAILSHVLGLCKCSSDVESLDSREEDEPWFEEYVLRQLRIEREMQFTQMANVLDCHPETAKKYVDDFEVSPLDSSDRTSSSTVNRLQWIGQKTDGDIQIE